MATKDISKVADHWGKSAPEEAVNIFNFSPIQRYFYQNITGDESSSDYDLTRWTVEKFLKDKKPIANLLSLGCGFGFLERALFRLGAFVKCTAIDISEAAIREATSRAKAENIHTIEYRVANLEELRLPPSTYDVIWMNGALHHLRRLEHVINVVKEALPPGGLLITNDFIGPNQQQLSERHREIINAVIHFIPSELRHANEGTFYPSFFRRPLLRRLIFEAWKVLTFKPGSLDIEALQIAPSLRGVKLRLYNLYRSIRRLQERKRRKFRFGKVWDNDPSYFRLVDPSECVRSADIVPVLRKTFPDIQVMDYYGSIVNFALDPKFIRKFRNGNPHHEKILELVLASEKTFVQIGEIPSCFAHIVCRKN
jgi:2-polyprenyl-3-methyl-5-hydroxy-6-metoxy-1,4-benzoquinol methylase